MKLKIKDICSNPFKIKYFKDDYNQNQIEQIENSYKELGLMGSLPVVKRKEKFYLVSHHHRLKSLINKYGEEYKVEVTLHNYTDEQLFRGLIEENILQRNLNFVNMINHVVAIRNALKDHPEWKCKNKTNNEVYNWIIKTSNKINRSDRDKVHNLLNVNDNLNDVLKKQLGKTISFSEAIGLARLNNKNHQTQIHSILKKTNLKTHDREELIMKFRKAPIEIQTKILKKEILIENVEIEIKKDEYQKERGIEPVQTVAEWILEISDDVEKLGQKLMQEKHKLPYCNKNQLQLLSRYLKVDLDNKFKPFLDDLTNELQKREVKQIEIIS